MVYIIAKLISSLSRKQKINLFLIQILLIIMSFFEILSIYTIAPFMGYISGVLPIENSKYLQFLFTIFKTDKDNFIYLFGVTLLGIYLFSILLGVLSQILSTRFGNKVGAQISYNMFINYINKSPSFFLSNNSSEISSALFNDSARVNMIVIRMMLINISLFRASLIIIALLFYNFQVTFVITLTLSVVYLVIFILLKRQIGKQGEDLSKSQAHLMKLINEGFGSFRDLAINKKHHIFSKFFYISRYIVAKAKTRVEIYASLPKYFVEGVGFVIVLSLIIILSHDKDTSFGNLIATLSIFGLSLIKLIPSFQNLYYNTADIKSSVYSFQKIQDEIHIKEKKFETRKTFVEKKNLNYLTFKKVSFKYQNNKHPAISLINEKIKLEGINIVVGKTGAGKSTFFNLALGLLDPSSGEIFVDDFNLFDEKNKNSWHKFVTYVPQSPFMLDSTIKQNIAYEYENIDENKINHAIKQAELEQLIKSLEKGLDTIVGENGVKLSGGQIQRIAIARAIYSGAKVLFLDEATNALDHSTENLIWKKFQNDKKGKCFFIISHNLNTLKYADNVILVENGGLNIINLKEISELKKSEIIKNLLNNNFNF